jgi:hypothetical protein
MGCQEKLRFPENLFPDAFRIATMAAGSAVAAEGGTRTPRVSPPPPQTQAALMED